MVAGGGIASYRSQWLVLYRALAETILKKTKLVTFEDEKINWGLLCRNLSEFGL